MPIFCRQVFWRSESKRGGLFHLTALRKGCLCVLKARTTARLTATPMIFWREAKRRLSKWNKPLSITRNLVSLVGKENYLCLSIILPRRMVIGHRPKGREECKVELLSCFESLVGVADFLYGIKDEMINIARIRVFSGVVNVKSLLPVGILMHCLEEACENFLCGQ